MKNKAITVFDKNIADQFKKAITIMMNRPEKALFFIKALKNQNTARIKRSKHLENNLEVPPLLIISITSSCNLNCKGCYSKHLHKESSQELTVEKFHAILKEAGELGISLVLLAGGEPLMRWELIKIAAEFPKIIFPIFTNALLIDEEKCQFFKSHQNLLPVISLEGREDETDSRRGDGIWENFQTMKDKFQKESLFWGISLTLNKNNYDLITSEDYTKQLLNKGCNLFFYVEYVPISDDSKELCLTPHQKENLQPIVNRFMAKFPGLFIAFPGDEDQYGGCLAAGRGFFHINPQGNAEPCPFAPFSDKNLFNGTLKDALSSPLFSYIREHHHLLKETEGGCALWANKEFLKKIDIKDESR